VAKKRSKLNLGQGSAFPKARLKRLPQADETWEADFRTLPKPITQSTTNYLGLVVTRPGGHVLAQTEIEGRPSVNHLATLLANAMRQPLVQNARRPTRLHLRGHRQWEELFPHLEELGVEVSVRSELPKVQRAYDDHMHRLREVRRKGMVKPTAEQAAVERLFPAVAQWVNGYGHIEIGDQEMFGFTARALDYGGFVFEDETAETLAEALAALEKGLARWFQDEGIEIEGRD
jgi:hypothetical protein